MVAWSVLHRAALLFLIVGLAFSLFSTAETYDKALQSSCDLNVFFSCGQVDSSTWSHLGPIPDWSIGVGGFVLMFLVEAWNLREFDPFRVKLLLLLSIGGLAVSIFLGSVEIVILNHVCPVCLGSYLSNIGVLGISYMMYRKRPPKSYRLKMERASASEGPKSAPTAEDGDGDEDSDATEADDEREGPSDDDVEPTAELSPGADESA